MSADQRSTAMAGGSAGQQAREQELVNRVLASFAHAGDARLRDVMQALTRHLHAFLREVRLTEEEWRHAITFLTEAGHITDDRRQEFILLSDVLGASMQMITINNEAYANATEATVVGPFFVEGSPADPARRGYRGRRGRRAVLGGGHGRSTPTASRFPGRGSRYGRPTRTASTTSSTPATGPRHAPTCSPTTRADTGSGGSPRPRTPSRTTGRGQAPRGRRPLPHARFAPALHGKRGRKAHPGDAHLRTRRRTADPRRGVRRQGLPGEGLRAAARGHAHARRPRSRGPYLVAGPLRHRPRTGRSVTRPPGLGPGCIT